MKPAFAALIIAASGASAFSDVSIDADSISIEAQRNLDMTAWNRAFLMANGNLGLYSLNDSIHLDAATVVRIRADQGCMFGGGALGLPSMTTAERLLIQPLPRPGSVVFDTDLDRIVLMRAGGWDE